MLKKPLSFEEQINRLNTHNIQVTDKDKAREILSTVNYYRLTGYALPFRISPTTSDCKPRTSFDQVFSLYCFDEELRHILRKYLEYAEVYYKTQISHWFSLRKCSLPPHDQHYNRENYYRKDFFDDIIKSFIRERDNFYKDSPIVKHHRDKYDGKMPLWVMLDLLSFSNTSKLFNSMYVSDQEAIAKHIGVSVKTLTNHLHCLSVLRNKCSHGARLYDSKLYPAAHLGNQFLKVNPDVSSDSVFAYILVLLRRLPSIAEKKPS